MKSPPFRAPFLPPHNLHRPWLRWLGVLFEKEGSWQLIVRSRLFVEENAVLGVVRNGGKAGATI